MNGKKSKLIRRQAEKLQVQWINKVTPQSLDKALPDQEYYYKGYTIHHSFMNHKWVEKKLKKNINISLDELTGSHG